MGRSGGTFLNNSFKNKQVIESIKPEDQISVRRPEHVQMQGFRNPPPCSIGFAVSRSENLTGRGMRVVQRMGISRRPLWRVLGEGSVNRSSGSRPPPASPGIFHCNISWHHGLAPQQKLCLFDEAFFQASSRVSLGR